MISLLGSQSDTFISNATLFVLGNFEGTLGLSVRPKSMSEQIAKFTLFQCLSQPLFCFQSPYKGESHRLL